MINLFGESNKHYCESTLSKYQVLPNVAEFHNTWSNALRIRVSEQAQKGKANKELVKKLEKIFNAEIEIIQGQKSRKKKILAKGLSKNQFLEKLQKLKT